MSLNDRIKTAYINGVLKSFLGQPITYTVTAQDPEQNTSKTIDAVIDRDVFSTSYSVEGASEIIEAEVYICSDETEGIPAPKIEDQVSFDNHTWTVKAIKPEPVDASITLRVIRKVIVERGRRDYRG
jgi:hypothetical protein